jgi:methionyl-tRNA formyltransferase
LNIVFFGTPDFATASLEALLAGGHTVPLVVTQPDQPSGRGRKLSEPSVKRFARTRGIPVLQPGRVRDEGFLRTLRDAGAKLFVVAAYGRILPAELLAIPDLILNVHASLLPKWRGAAPIARSILAGEAETGVSIMRLVLELDAGDVLLRKGTTIGENESAGELTGRLSKLGGEALLEALDVVARGEARFTPQDRGNVTFAPPVKAEEGRIDWARSVRDIHNQVRAFNPWPGAFTCDGKQRIKLWRTERTTGQRQGEATGTLRAEPGGLQVAAGDGWLRILELQREGKARQEVRSFLPGYPLATVSRWL